MRRKFCACANNFIFLSSPARSNAFQHVHNFFLNLILPSDILCQIHSTASRALINSCHYLVGVIGGVVAKGLVITTVRIRCPGLDSNIPISGTSPSVLQDHSRMGVIGGCAMLSGCYMCMRIYACFVFNYECTFDAYPTNVRSCPL